MKIDKSSTPLPTPTASEGKAGGAPKANVSTAPQQPAGTSVSLGAAASHLRSMEGESSGTSPVDAAKVAEIKQAISEGRFKINSNLVADRLLTTVRDLIGDKA